MLVLDLELTLPSSPHLSGAPCEDRTHDLRIMLESEAD